MKEDTTFIISIFQSYKGIGIRESITLDNLKEILKDTVSRKGEKMLSLKDSISIKGLYMDSYKENILSSDLGKILKDLASQNKPVIFQCRRNPDFGGFIHIKIAYVDKYCFQSYIGPANASCIKGYIEIKPIYSVYDSENLQDYLPGIMNINIFPPSIQEQLLINFHENDIVKSRNLQGKIWYSIPMLPNFFWEEITFHSGVLA